MLGMLSSFRFSLASIKVSRGLCEPFSDVLLGHFGYRHKGLTRIRSTPPDLVLADGRIVRRRLERMGKKKGPPTMNRGAGRSGQGGAGLEQVGSGLTLDNDLLHPTNRA